MAVVRAYGHFSDRCTITEKPYLYSYLHRNINKKSQYVETEHASCNALIISAKIVVIGSIRVTVKALL